MGGGQSGCSNQTGTRSHSEGANEQTKTQRYLDFV